MDELLETFEVMQDKELIGDLRNGGGLLS